MHSSENQRVMENAFCSVDYLIHRQTAHHWHQQTLKSKHHWIESNLQWKSLNLHCTILRSRCKKIFILLFYNNARSSQIIVSNYLLRSWHLDRLSMWPNMWRSVSSFRELMWNWVSWHTVSRIFFWGQSSIPVLDILALCFRVLSILLKYTYKISKIRKLNSQWPIYR